MTIDDQVKLTNELCDMLHQSFCRGVIHLKLSKAEFQFSAVKKGEKVLFLKTGDMGLQRGVLYLCKLWCINNETCIKNIPTSNS